MRTVKNNTQTERRTQMLTEKEARLSRICPGCGKEKGLELIVCWDCFKYRTDKTPFKYFEGKSDNPLQEWLDYLKS